MKPLVVLIAVFLISLFIIKATQGKYEYALAGRIAISCMLLFTSIAHFAFTKGLSMMLPGFVPYKTEIVYFTGVIEVLAAIALLIPVSTRAAGWLLIVFFLMLLPANIYASINHVDYQKGTFDGNGLKYLWFRVPLQILFIAWTYFSAVRI